jgi:nicotinamide-nucleotide amidase
MSDHYNDEALMALAVTLGQGLQRADKMLVTAESCTGGWVAQSVTAIAGSSAWFDRGFVTYSNEAKQEMLGVKADTLATYGAVSEPTAREMVAGALAHSRATIAISITGVAGPSGGSPAKPVGTVCIGWAQRGQPAMAKTYSFSGDREAIRRQSVGVALEGVIERCRE